MRKLVDTNIIVYALDEESEFHTLAVDVLSYPKNVVALQNLTETYRVITSKVQFNNPFSAIEAWEKLYIIAENLNVIYPDEKTFEILGKLAAKYGTTSYQTYDAMLVACMIREGVKCVVTNNPKDFQKYEEIRVQSLVPTPTRRGRKEDVTK